MRRWLAAWLLAASLALTPGVAGARPLFGLPDEAPLAAIQAEVDQPEPALDVPLVPLAPSLTSVAGMVEPEPTQQHLFARSVVCPVLYTHEVPSTALLEAQISALLTAGYRPTSLLSVDRAMGGIAPTPPGCLVLTFDDALYSQYQNALPALADLGVPAVFFVMPAFADGVHRYMTATQIAELRAAGHEVMPHTCNHPTLPLLALRGDDPLMAELYDCRRMVEAITHAPAPYFAYPNGAYNATVLRAVIRSGYRLAFTTRPGALLTAQTPLTLPRIDYTAADRPATLLARVRASGG